MPVRTMYYQSKSETRLWKFTLLMLLTSAFLNIGFLLYNGVLFPSQVQTIIGLSCFILTIGLLFLLKKSTRAYLTMNLYFVMITCVIIAINLTSETYSGYILLWGAQLIIFHNYLFSQRSGWLVTIIISLLLTASEIIRVKFSFYQPQYVEYNHFYLFAIGMSVFYINKILSESINYEEENLKRELSKQYDEIANLNQANSAIVTLLCHDIVTPLTVLKFQLHKLKTKEIIPKKELLEMEGHCNDVTELLASIRKIKGLNSGKIILNKVPMDFSQVIEEIALEMGASHKEIDFNLQRNIFVYADIDAMKSLVLTNIIGFLIHRSKSNSKLRIVTQNTKDSIRAEFFANVDISVVSDVRKILSFQKNMNPHVQNEKLKNCPYLKKFPLCETLLFNHNSTIETEYQRNLEEMKISIVFPKGGSL
jgi:signal transduction histidine kinase